MSLAKVVFKNKKVIDYVPGMRKEKTWMWVCIVLNIIFSGVGTIIGGIMTKDKDKKLKQILVGVAQFFTSFILVGWIWSVFWAYLIHYKSTFDLKDAANIAKAVL